MLVRRSHVTVDEGDDTDDGGAERDYADENREVAEEHLHWKQAPVQEEDAEFRDEGDEPVRDSLDSQDLGCFHVSAYTIR